VVAPVDIHPGHKFTDLTKKEWWQRWMHTQVTKFTDLAEKEWWQQWIHIQVTKIADPG